MDKIKRLAKYLGQQHVPIYAGNASFFLILAVFPSLVILLALMRYTGLQIETFTELMEEVIPASLMPMVNRLVRSAYVNSSGTLLSVSAIAALWSSSRGIYGLLAGLNAVYGVRESRGYFYTRGISAVYTFLFLLVLLMTLILQVFGKEILACLPFENGLLEHLVDFRALLLLGVQILLFTAVYVALPNRKGKISLAFPGAVFAALGWMIFSQLYSIYVELFASLSNIYGSVYAVALSMLWLYCCISIVFYGGVINRYLEEK